MSQKKAGVLINYCIMGFNIIIGLLYTPFMLSKLGDSEYGIYSLSVSLVSFITLLDLGLGQTLVRYIAKARALGNRDEEAKLNGFFFKMYLAIAAVGIILGLSIILIYPYVCKSSMTENELLLFRIVFSILLLNAVISFPMCVFSSTINAYERFFFQKVVNLAINVFKYMGLILLLILGFRVIAITVTTFIASVLMQVIYAGYCFKKIEIKFEFKGFEKKIIKEIGFFSFYIFLNLIIDFLYSNTDKLILGALSGTVAVTIYSIGIYFQSYFQELSSAMSGVFLPQITSLHERDHDSKEISNIFLRIGRLQLALLTMVLGGYILLGKEFTSLWVGAEYLDAYYIGLIILIPAIIPLTQNIGISILRAMNLHKYRSYMYLVIAVMNVVISIPLARRWSGIGSAIGTSIATIAGQIIFMNWFYYKRIYLNIKQYWLNVSMYFAVTAAIVAIGFFLKHFFDLSTWADFVLFGFVYCLFLITVYWLILFNDYEKEIIKSLIMKIIRKKI